MPAALETGSYRPLPNTLEGNSPNPRLLWELPRDGRFTAQVQADRSGSFPNFATLVVFDRKRKNRLIGTPQPVVVPDTVIAGSTPPVGVEIYWRKTALFQIDGPLPEELRTAA